MSTVVLEANNAIYNLELINSLTIGDIVHIVEEVLPQEAERPITIISLYKNGENFRVTDNTVLYLEVEENTSKKRKYKIWKSDLTKMYGTGDFDTAENIGAILIKSFRVVSQNSNTKEPPFSGKSLQVGTDLVEILRDPNIDTGVESYTRSNSNTLLSNSFGNTSLPGNTSGTFEASNSSLSNFEYKYLRVGDCLIVLDGDKYKILIIKSLFTINDPFLRFETTDNREGYLKGKACLIGNTISVVWENGGSGTKGNQGSPVLIRIVRKNS